VHRITQREFVGNVDTYLAKVAAGEAVALYDDDGHFLCRLVPKTVLAELLERGEATPAKRRGPDATAEFDKARGEVLKLRR